ncbi:translocase of chloroplast 159, chloroplastic-like isoform X1 [Papaver somniferum]|uniref:translocase of chloroplast 159, chloroplastic-like isoform X1 n=1 Tax=Papaver somniferum TaxID=3469 RepID=UPI000E6F77DD|nr:translocase of chloroplast 159, chloroplastic-like isoform X1 [Papaver somniferum]
MDNPVSLSTTQLNPPSEEEDVKEESLSQLKNTSSGISSSSSVAALPIRAPLSFDSDVDNNQTPIKINGTNTSLKVANIGFVDSDSDIVLSSSDDEEEGFLSGEDEFGITSSDRNFLADPDEKTLDMLLGTEKIVPFVAPQPVFVASPSSSLIDDKVFVPPKALLSGDDDEDDEGFVSGLDEDEGLSDVSNVVTSVKIPSVESSMIPKALVSGEDDVVPDIVDKVDSEVSSIAMVPSVIEKTKVAEENISPEEVVSSSVEMIVPVVTEAAPIESSVVMTEDTLLKDTKSDEVDVSPPEEEVKESKDVVAVEKKIDVPELVTETKDSLEVRENGVSDVPAQESVGADSGDNQSGVEELVKSVFPVEVQDINASNAEDSNVETKQPILVELEKTVDEVVENEKVSEPKIVEILVDKDVSLGSQPEKAAVVVEELVEPKLVEDTAGAIADAPSGLESGEKEKDDDAEKIAEGVHGSTSIVPEELKPETEAGSLAKPEERVVDKGADGVESKASVLVNGLTETQIVDSIVAPVESGSVSELKHLDNGIGSEPKIVEILVDKDVMSGIQSEPAPVFVEKPVEPKLVEDIIVAIADAQSSLEKGEKEKDDDNEKSVRGINEIVPKVPEELKPEAETVSGAKLDELVVDEAVEPISGNGVNTLTETQIVDSIPVPVESSSATEGKHLNNGVESEAAAVVVEEPVAIADAQSSLETGENEKDDDDEKSAGGIDGSVSRVPEEHKSEPEAGARAKPDEHVLDDSKADIGVNGLTETQSGDTVTVPAQSKDRAVELENAISGDTEATESAVPKSVLALDGKQESEDEVEPEPNFTEEDEDSASDEGNKGIMFDGSETAEQIMKELERASGSHSGGDNSQDSFQRIDGQVVMDSDEEVDTDEDGDGKELFDSAALAALLKAATGAGSDGGNVTITAPDGSRLFSIERPAGLGSSMRSLKPAPRATRPNLFSPSDLTAGGEPENELSEEEKKKLEKIQQIRVKFLRLVQRLGQSPEESIAAQVLYRLLLAAGRQTSQSFSLDAARRTAAELEAEGKDDLDFSLNILVLGKTGVGKSATINSIFGEKKSHIDPFEPGTTEVKEIVGKVDGVTIRVYDTPGLRSSVMEQAFNQKVLASVKKLTKKNPLDILLYVDRLDTQTRDLNDMPLLRSITATLGSAIWRSAIVTLTHAASAPPDGPSGHPLSYDTYVGQRSHIVQQSVGQAVGDLRMMNPSLMNPVSLVENHPSCRTNREGQQVLPNGQTWKPQLLLLCYSMKILSEASSLSKPQDPFDHRKLFGFRVRAPPLPYLLSTMLQSRAHPKLASDQGIDNGDSDIELGDMSDSDQEEEEDEYDQLPPFKPLRKSQIAKLSKEQRKAYFDEYDYRVKLLQKKQLREELKRMREMKKGKDTPVAGGGFMGEDADQENDGPAAVPVALPDMVLPPSFDGDNPAYRYRFLEPTSQLLARPVLDNHGWDHDCGYDGVSLEQSHAIMSKFPGVVAVQITKDKKEFNIHLDSSVAAKYGESGSTLAGFDIQTIGKQLGYIVRGETKFKNFKKNKTAAGVAITFLGETVTTGLKVEDQIAIGKRLSLVGSTGTVRSQGEAAYGANLEVRLKEKDFPIGQDQSTLGLSLMKWRGDLAVGGNFQSQISVGRSSKVSVRVGLNNKLSGQITVRTSSSEQLQLALVGLLPIAVSIYRTIFPGAAGDTYSAY